MSVSWMIWIPALLAAGWTIAAFWFEWRWRTLWAGMVLPVLALVWVGFTYI